MKTVVFVGPSMTLGERRAIIGAQVTSPVCRGDLKRFAEHDLFVILDGEFGQNLSVSPKEILQLLDAGKTVIGAASMGALRASELDSFGMIGVGWVYRKFASAAVRNDDDVALCYSPFDLSPTTIPMVDIEYRMELLMAEGRISRKEAAKILRKARSVFFADRTEELLYNIIKGVSGPKTIGRVDELHMPSIKSLDAAEALKLASTLASSSKEV
jgi:hypothetical protein